MVLIHIEHLYQHQALHFLGVKHREEPGGKIIKRTTSVDAVWRDSLANNTAEFKNLMLEIVEGSDPGIPSWCWLNLTLVTKQLSFWSNRVRVLMGVLKGN